MNSVSIYTFNLFLSSFFQLSASGKLSLIHEKEVKAKYKAKKNEENLRGFYALRFPVVSSKVIRY